MNDDTISRQSAIDALNKMKIYRPLDSDRYVISDCLNKIVDLPSAQSERTCVNCGRTVNNGGWYADGGTRCPIEEHYALPKDGFCHLWEKRNVTDDDYPERTDSVQVGDCVSRQAAVDAIVNTVSEIGLHDNSEVARYGATFRQHEIIDIIEGMPSAQPERKKGKWEIYVISMFDGEGCRCSECGLEGVPYWDFCPNCGADMREVDDERPD